MCVFVCVCVCVSGAIKFVPGHLPHFLVYSDIAKIIAVQRGQLYATS